MSERPTQKREDYLSVILTLMVAVVWASIYLMVSPDWRSWFSTFIR